MKKSTLALSVAAALGGLGMASNALAVTGFTPATGNDKIVRNDNGIGHQLVFPYFTAQNGNATLLTITNTDTTNGKLVKVRFRGAANSDDLYDFQVALSPGDIWTAAVTKDAASGAAKVETTDKSCTVPKSINGVFNTQRVDGASAAQTLEGYVEVINMANIAPVTTPSTTAASSLYKAIKHKDGVADCTVAVIAEKLGVDGSVTELNAKGLSAPTTGLVGDWIILNQNTTAAWSGSATALEVRNAANTAATTGNLVFWPQTTGTPSGWEVDKAKMTADPLLVTGLVEVQNYDLPDLSTPYVAGKTTANDQADATTSELAVKSISNQYATEAAINGVTDILFSQPMRRYAAAVNYKSSTVTDGNNNTFVVPFATNGTRAQAIYRGANPDSTALTSTLISNVTYKVAAPTTGVTADANLATAVGTGNAYYSPRTTSGGNLAIPSGKRNLCLYSINGAGENTIFDREETTPTSSSSSSVSFVISPSVSSTTATPQLTVCGEAAVVSINNGDAAASGALSGSIALTDISATSLTAYQAGWITFNTATSANPNGLPIIGGSFMRAANGAVNYGFHYANKVTR